MLLAIDIENRQTTFGVFDKDDFVANFCLASNKDRSANELALIIKALIREAKLSPSAIDEVIISSVVPELDETYRQVANLISCLLYTSDAADETLWV